MTELASPGGTPEEPLVQTIVVARTSDIGGFEVRRILPSIRRRTVGPFVFLDQMGPEILAAGRGLDVRPHPHIGLATVTYLLAGSILHRDSLGSVQPILPGAVNWMSAGRGIVHSERTAESERGHEKPLFGLQLWVALPAALEESAPGFTHYERSALPTMEGEGVAVRIIAGSGFGLGSPVRTPSELFLHDLELAAGARVTIAADQEERALYPIEGTVEIEGIRHEAGRLLVLAPGRPVDVLAVGRVRLAALGGAPLDGPRHIWWNFVSSRKERIEQAKEDWRRDRFGLPVPGDSAFIPLPEG